MPTVHFIPGLAPIHPIATFFSALIILVVFLIAIMFIRELDPKPVQWLTVICIISVSVELWAYIVYPLIINKQIADYGHVVCFNHADINTDKYAIKWYGFSYYLSKEKYKNIFFIECTDGRQVTQEIDLFVPNGYPPLHQASIKEPDGDTWENYK